MFDVPDRAREREWQDFELEVGCKQVACGHDLIDQRRAVYGWWQLHQAEQPRATRAWSGHGSLSRDQVDARRESLMCQLVMTASMTRHAARPSQPSIGSARR